MDINIHVGELRPIDIRVELDPEPEVGWLIRSATYQIVFRDEVIGEGIPMVDQDTHIMTVNFAPTAVGVHRIRVDFWVGSHHLIREHEITVRGF